MAVDIELAGKKTKAAKPDKLVVKSPVEKMQTVTVKVSRSKKEENINIVDKTIELAQMVENLSGELENYRKTIIDHATISKDKSLKDGTFVKTIEVEGTCAKIQVQFKDSYSALDAKMEVPLREIFQDKFQTMFKVLTSVSIRENKVKELKELLGDRYEAFVDEVTVVKPSSEFQYSYFLMKDSLNKDQTETVQKVLDAAQSSPAMKLPK